MAPVVNNTLDVFERLFDVRTDHGDRELLVVAVDARDVDAAYAELGNQLSLDT